MIQILKAQITKRERMIQRNVEKMQSAIYDGRFDQIVFFASEITRHNAIRVTLVDLAIKVEDETASLEELINVQINDIIVDRQM